MARGYDSDAQTIAKVRGIMESEAVARRQAILRLEGPHNLRRIEMKMKREDDERRALARERVASDHASRFPCQLLDGERGCGFVAVIPAPNGSRLAVAVQVESDGPKRGFIGSVAAVPEAAGLAATMELHYHCASSEHAIAAAGLLGLTGDGSQAVVRLASSLHAAWSEAGLSSPDDPEDRERALATERLRLEVSGLAETSALIPREAWRVASAYEGMVEPAILSRLMVRGMDAPRLALLSSLSNFAHPAIGNLTREDVDAWSGRPLECLVRHLNGDADIRLGRPVTLADVAWLREVVESRISAHLSHGVVEVLLRSQGQVDPFRVGSAEDALALVALGEAILALGRGRADHPDVVDGSRLLFDRIDGCVDSSSGYALVLADLKAFVESQEGTYSTEGLARAVEAATYGIEALKVRFALDLVIPTVVTALPSEGAAGPVGTLSGRAWPARVEAHAHRMATTGRGLADMAAAGRGLAAEGGRLLCRVDEETVRTTARHWATRQGTRGDVDDAWERLGPAVSPRMRALGRSGVEDHFVGLALIERTDTPRRQRSGTAAGGILKAVRRRLVGEA